MLSDREGRGLEVLKN